MSVKGPIAATKELARDAKRAGKIEFDRRMNDAELAEGDDPVSRARNAGMIISVVVIGVVALVGLLIFGEVYSAMPLDSGVFNSSEGGALAGYPDDIATGFGDAIGLIPIILIVLLASVVIGVVQRMR